MKAKVLKKIFREALKEAIQEDEEFRRGMQKIIAESLKKNMKTIIREAVLSDGTLSDIIAESVSGVAQSENRSVVEESAKRKKSKKSSEKKKNNGGSIDFSDLLGTDVAKDTAPAPDPGKPVGGGNAAPAAGGGQMGSIKQAEQAVKQMRGQGAGPTPQAAAKQQMQQPQQGQQQVKEGSMGYSTDDELMDKLRSGDRSHLQEKKRKFASKQKQGGD